MSFVRNLLFIAICVLIFPNLILAGDMRFSNLEKRLIEDGFKKEFISSVFNNNDTVFLSNRISSYFSHDESKLNYCRFSSKEFALKTLAYMKKHQKSFDEAEKQYGVDKTIIAAIMLVETRLGAFLGRDLAINILSTMATLMPSDKKNRLLIWQEISKNNKISKKRFNAIADKKSAWAYKELKAFLQYIQKEKLNPNEIKSSYAGAIGIAQFMPSNVLKLGVDGNNNSKVNLFEEADAIYSIANYLKYHGFKKDMTVSKTVKIIRTYNHSIYYANAVISISNLLKFF